MRAKLEVSELTRLGSSRPQLTGQVRHRRFAGRGDVRVVPSPHGWDVLVQLSFHGRGVLRLPIAVASPFIRRAMRRSVDQALARLPEHVRWLNRAMASITDEAAEVVAARLFDQAIRTIDTASAAGKGRA